MLSCGQKVGGGVIMAKSKVVISKAGGKGVKASGVEPIRESLPSKTINISGKLRGYMTSQARPFEKPSEVLERLLGI